VKRIRGIATTVTVPSASENAKFERKTTYAEEAVEVNRWLGEFFRGVVAAGVNECNRDIAPAEVSVKAGDSFSSKLTVACRRAFPTKRNFPDDLLLAEIGTKTEQSRAVAQFNGYVQRNAEVGKVLPRIEAIAEGDKILKIVQRQIQEYQYPNRAVTITSVCANLNLVDDFLIRKKAEQQAWLQGQFPGYASA
jgi:hypothetical protein